MAAENGAVKEKKKLRHVKKRIFFYPLIGLVLALLVFDLYCEIYTLPSSIEKAIQRKLQEKGITIRIKNARAGIFHGVVLDDVTIMDPTFSARKMFTAESIRFNLPIRLKGLSVEKFSIHGGNLNIPLFPETGEEGLYDVLNFQNIEANIERKGNSLEILYATTLLNGFLLNVSGELRDVFAEGSFIFQSANGLDQKDMAPSSSVSAIPMNTRVFFMNELRNVKRSTFSKMPLLQVHLSLDMKELAKSMVDCKLKIPSFKFRDYSVEEIGGILSIKDKSLHLGNLAANLGKTGQVRVVGDLDLQSMTFKGIISGKLLLNRFLLPEELPAMKNISIPDRMSDIEIIISSFSILTYNGNINASASLPAAEVFKIPLTDIRLATMLSFDEKQKTGIYIDKAKLSFNKGEYLDFSGEFDHKAKKISGALSGRIIATRFHPLLDEKTRAFIDPIVKLGNEPLSFSGHIEKITPDIKGIQASASVKFPSVRIYDAAYKDISATVSVDGLAVKAKDILATTPEGNRIDGELEINIPDEHVYISLHSSGNPAFVYKTSEGKARVFMESLYSKIKWPAKNESVDMNARVNFFMKPKPCFYLVGDIVLCDFSYNEVPFDYGSCAYTLDSNQMSLLPRVVLQQGKNSAFISLAYDNRIDLDVFPHSDMFNVPSKGTDKLYFDVDSTLPGNSILKFLVPDWKHDRLDMSGSSPVKVSGMIDFVNTANTCFEAKLKDGQGEWSGIPMKQITAAITMKNHVVEVKDLTADLFNGDLAFAYSYNIADNKGKISINVDKAEFAPLVKNLGFTDFATKKIGSLTGDMIADLSFNEKNELMMDGKGKISLQDADIMDIPVLKGFTEMLGKSVISSEWGEISSADCNFTLEKDHFKSDSVQTNGNAIALSAEGKYYWNTNETDFKVRAKILKNILPFELMSKFMDPLSWALEARLHGKGKDLKWEQSSSIKRLFQ